MHKYRWELWEFTVSLSTMQHPIRHFDERRSSTLHYKGTSNVSFYIIIFHIGFMYDDPVEFKKFKAKFADFSPDKVELNWNRPQGPRHALLTWKHSQQGSCEACFLAIPHILPRRGYAYPEPKTLNWFWALKPNRVFDSRRDGRIQEFAQDHPCPQPSMVRVVQIPTRNEAAIFVHKQISWHNPSLISKVVKDQIFYYLPKDKVCQITLDQRAWMEANFPRTNIVRVKQCNLCKFWKPKGARSGPGVIFKDTCWKNEKAPNQIVKRCVQCYDYQPNTPPLPFLINQGLQGMLRDVADTLVEYFFCWKLLLNLIKTPFPSFGQLAYFVKFIPDGHTKFTLTSCGAPYRLVCKSWCEKIPLIKFERCGIYDDEDDVVVNQFKVTLIYHNSPTFISFFASHIRPLPLCFDPKEASLIPTRIMVDK